MTTHAWMLLGSADVAWYLRRDALFRAAWAVTAGEYPAAAEWYAVACAHQLRAEAHVLSAILAGWEPDRGRLLPC